MKHQCEARPGEVVRKIRVGEPRVRIRTSTPGRRFPFSKRNEFMCYRGGLIAVWASPPQPWKSSHNVLYGLC